MRLVSSGPAKLCSTNSSRDLISYSLIVVRRPKRTVRFARTTQTAILEAVNPGFPMLLWVFPAQTAVALTARAAEHWFPRGITGNEVAVDL